MTHDDTHFADKSDRRGTSDVAWLKCRNRTAREDYVIRAPLGVIRIKAKARRTECKRPAVPELETLLVADRALRKKTFGVHLLPGTGTDHHAVRKFVSEPDNGVRVYDRLRRTARKRLFVSAVVRDFRAVA